MDWNLFRLATAGGASFFCFSLALTAYWKDKTSLLHKNFAAFNFFLGLWNISDIAISLSPAAAALYLDRLSYVWGTLLMPSFFYLCLEFAEAKTTPRVRRYLNLSTSALIILSLTPWLIKGVKIKPYFVEIPGPLYAVFILVFLWWIGWGVIKLFKTYKVSTGFKKNQMRYVFLGYFLGFMAAVTYFAYVADPTIPPIFYVLETAYTGLLGYAIIRYRIMEINLAFRYGVILTIYVAIMVTPFAAAAYFSYGRIPAFWILGIMASALISPWVFKQLNPSLTQLVDLLPLFRGRYTQMSKIPQLTEDIAKSGTPKEVYQRVLKAVIPLANPSRAYVLVRETMDRLRIQADFGVDNDAEKLFLTLNVAHPLAQILAKHQSMVMRDYLDKGEEINQVVQEEMNALKAVVAIPIFVKDELHAVVCLDQKPDGRIYNEVELNSLNAVVRAAERVLYSLIISRKQEQVAAVWAHDLMKPFNRASGSFQRLSAIRDEAYGPVSGEIKGLIDLVLSDVDYVRDHLHNVIESSSILEKYDIKPRPLNGVFARIREKFFSTTQTRKINFVVEIPPEYVRVKCDAIAIEYRVLTNLMDNALRYTPDGGTIRVGFDFSIGEFMAYVRDSGPGIPEKDIDKLFQRGAQISATNKGMAGLGLYSVANVIEAQEGVVWAESPPGQGATFYFRLPMEKFPQGLA